MKFKETLQTFLLHERDMFFTLQKNTIISWCTKLTIVFIFGAFVLLIVFWGKLPSEIPLWYSKPWGQDRLTSPKWLFLLPGSSILWYLINTFLSLHITKDHLVFSQILLLSSLVVSFFSIVTLGMIIWIIS